VAWSVPVSVWSALPGAGRRSRAIAAECALHFLSIERSGGDIGPLSVISSGIGAGSVVLSIMVSPGMLKWYEYCVTACVTGMWVVGYVTVQLRASRSIMVCRCRGINRLSRPYICSARPGGPGLCHRAE